MDSDEEFEEEVAIQKAPKKKKDKKGKKSIEEADPMFCSLYKEAESDDEFAKEFLMFPNGNPDNDDEDRKGKRAKRKAFKKKKNNVTINASTDENTPRSINECNDDPLDGNLNLVAAEDSGDEQNEDDENQSDDDDDEKIDYRIQYILDCRSLSAMEWKDILIKMDTREVTRGSVLQQPDEEFYDPSPELVEKFLIKWQHASFLHLSWETEKDLLDICGKTVSNSIKKFRYRILTKTDLFEDLRMGESFPPQYLHVDRILDIEDDTVNIQTMDWAKARLPSYGGEVESASTNAIVDEVAEEKEDEEVVDTEATDTATDDTVDMMSDENDLKDSPIKSTSENEPKRSKRKVVTGSDKAETKKKSRKPKIVDLHGANCWVVVKWEGLAYSEFTLESAYDLSKAGVEYEFALREFFRREQQAPRVGVRGKVVRSLFNMATVLESPEPPIFPVGQLRDYQWEGVRWLLFNWSQKRNSILADEMVRFLLCPHLHNYFSITKC